MKPAHKKLFDCRCVQAGQQPKLPWVPYRYSTALGALKVFNCPECPSVFNPALGTAAEPPAALRCMHPCAGPAGGAPPPPAWVITAPHNHRQGAQAKGRASESSASHGPASTKSSEGKRGNDEEEEEEGRVLERAGVNGRLRLLRAGAWPMLHACRCRAGPGCARAWVCVRVCACECLCVHTAHRTLHFCRCGCISLAGVCLCARVRQRLQPSLRPPDHGPCGHACAWLAPCTRG